jgi:hypothetical protein
VEAAGLSAAAAALPFGAILMVADAIVVRPDRGEKGMTIRGMLAAALVALVALTAALAASAAGPQHGAPGAPTLLATLPGGAASGSAIGPGGALFVPEPATGQIWRIDPRTGDQSLFASGLPPRFAQLPFGGVMDVAFRGSTAYALVSVVGSKFPDDLVACHPGTVGIFRLDGPTTSTLVADIGSFACANPPPPTFPIVVPTGVQYALEPFRGGFLVTDGHHNRVYYAAIHGTKTISVARQFGDIVPTGLATQGNTVFMAEAGPVPHLPQNGKVVSFEPFSGSTTTIASGAPLLVDVEFGRGQTLFALSQGIFTCGADPMCAGSPASHGTGSLVRANANGTFTTVAGGLDQPSSLEVVDNTAYVVTLGGKVWKVNDIAGPPFG